MEEPMPAQTTPTQLSNPPTIAQCPPPKPPAPTPLPPKSKKRPLDTSIHIENPNYFQMRVVIKELRPHFLEVLRTPDFRNCKAAEEIRGQMKLLKEAYKKITAETVSVSKSKNVAEGQPLSGENQDDQKPQEQPQDLKPTTEQPQQDKAFAKPSENKFVSSVASEKRGEKRGADDVKIHGSYVIGGSAFGWNYITYLGDDPVYYGVTKESFRISNSSK